MTLFPHQVESAKRLLVILRRNFAAADISETGVGKTVTALQTALLTGLSFFVICPKNLISHWRRWIREMGLESRCLGVTNWEQAKLGKTKFYTAAGGWSVNGDKYLIIADEAHKAKWFRTQNSQMLRKARERGLPLLLLSATLIENSLALSGLGFVLRFIPRQSHWFSFARAYGAYLNEWGGYAHGSTRMQNQALHLLLEKVSVRVKRRDIAIEDVITRVDLVDTGNVEAIRRAYKEHEEKLRELERLEAAASIVLVERLRARQKIELLKTSLYVEEALDHLDQGLKVCLFLNFNDSVEAAGKLFKKANIDVGIITGETPLKTREQLIETFNFADLDILILNIAAGGEGISLHDQDGRKARVAILSPPESATVLLQALGRVGGRAGAQSVGLNRLLYVAETVETTVYDNVAAKVNRLATINDGDLKPKF